MSTSEEYLSARHNLGDDIIRARVLFGGPGSHPVETGSEDERQTLESQGRRVDWNSKTCFQASLSFGSDLIRPPYRQFVFEPFGSACLRTRSTPPWPNIKIGLGPQNLGQIEVSCSDNSVQAGILLTRVQFALRIYRQCVLKDPAGRLLLELQVVSGDANESLEQILSLARIYRKLLLIEKVFNVRFDLPAAFSAADIRNLEICFRAITEGDFWSRSDSITFLDLTNDDSVPVEPGPFVRTFLEPNFRLLGLTLRTGPHSVRLNRALVADEDDVRNTFLHGVRIIVLDSMVNYRFETFASRPFHVRRRLLDQMKVGLLEEEPETLVECVEDLLISDVSADSAIRIVNGWLQFYDFPDRFFPQNPILQGDVWKVPLWITFSSSQGGWIQDLFVDLKSGQVTSPVSVEELRRLGNAASSMLPRAV